MNCKRLRRNIGITFVFAFGVAAMCYAGYGWHKDWLTDWQALTTGVIGFILMFIPDKLQDIMAKSLSLIFDLAINRFFGRGGGKAVMLLLLATYSYAQTGAGNFSVVRLVNAGDGSTVLPIEGSIYYNESEDKFKGYQDGQWVDLIGSFEFDGTPVANGLLHFNSTADAPTSTAGLTYSASTLNVPHAISGLDNSLVEKFNINANGDSYFAGGRVGIGGVPESGYDLHLLKGTGALTLGLKNTGSGQVVVEWNRTGGTASRWQMYLPTGLGDIRLWRSGQGDLFTYSSGGVGTATDWVATSDARIKTGVRHVASTLDKVNTISQYVVNYDRTDNGKNEIGFIAQELYKVAPEYVNVPEDSAALWSVNYAKMVVPLYKAIEELTARIKELEKKCEH